MRIGILTGGGDVPGLNSCIKAVVRRAYELDWEVVGFRRGWAGPLNFNPDNDEVSRRDWIMELDPSVVRGIDRSGGTILHSSRTNPANVRASELPQFLSGSARNQEEEEGVDCTKHVMRTLEYLGIEALVTIGGDDTLSFSSRLHAEGVRVISIPKTMDNDVFGTDYCIGFSTAVTRSVDLISSLRTTAGSHERIGVIELFGRNSGETALISGYLADSDRVLISEIPFDCEKLARQLVEDREINPANYALVVVSEGARMKDGSLIEKGVEDAYGHRKLGGIGEATSEELKRLTGIETINQSLGYLMRAGVPDALDLLVSSSFGSMAVQQLSSGKSGLMMALRDGKYDTVPGDISIQGTKRVDVEAFYDTESYRPRIACVTGNPMFLY